LCVYIDKRTYPISNPTPAAAEAAFRELISREDLKGQSAAAVLSLDDGPGTICM